MTKSLRTVLIALGAGVVGVGCGSNSYQMAAVSGRVTCQGKPAAGGVVIFQPIDAPERTGRSAGHPGGASSGTVGADGTFTLKAQDGKSGDGALVGPHRVLFQPPPTKRPPITADDRSVLSPEELKALEQDIARRPVYPPLPCADKVTPGEVEVKPGKTEFEFTLQPK